MGAKKPTPPPKNWNPMVGQPTSPPPPPPAPPSTRVVIEDNRIDVAELASVIAERVVEVGVLGKATIQREVEKTLREFLGDKWHMSRREFLT